MTQLKANPQSVGGPTKLFGAVEAGGTKFVCAVGTGPDDIKTKTTFATRDPAATLGDTINFFRTAVLHHGPLTAVGVGSFGPIDVHRNSKTFGHITATPKPGWSHVDIAGPLAREFQVPVAFDTDVNAAALGEARWGAGQGCEVLVYVTVGTGIGGGVLHAGKLLHGLVHPEIGHQRIPHDIQVDPYQGHCPFHSDCLEGLASGAAMEDRWQSRGEQLPEDHPCWELEASYLAYGLSNIALMFSPHRIILGGGVMKHAPLLDMVRQRVSRTLAGYIKHPALEDDLSGFIVAPALHDRSGVLGALALALEICGN